ncbi:hypothetical protein LTR66_012781 [Elasticomyces elasticus]|nr:hypothetical protein LTR66_012781 [Elasticomyces elasticus]
MHNLSPSLSSHPSADISRKAHSLTSAASSSNSKSSKASSLSKLFRVHSKPDSIVDVPPLSLSINVDTSITRSVTVKPTRTLSSKPSDISTESGHPPPPGFSRGRESLWSESTVFDPAFPGSDDFLADPASSNIRTVVSNATTNDPLYHISAPLSERCSLITLSRFVVSKELYAVDSASTSSAARTVGSKEAKLEGVYNIIAIPGLHGTRQPNRCHLRGHTYLQYGHGKLTGEIVLGIGLRGITTSVSFADKKVLTYSGDTWKDASGRTVAKVRASGKRHVVETVDFFPSKASQFVTVLVNGADQEQRVRDLVVASWLAALWMQKTLPDLKRSMDAAKMPTTGKNRADLYVQALMAHGQNRALKTNKAVLDDWDKACLDS